MILQNPYSKATNNALQPYNAKQNFAKKDPNNIIFNSIKNSLPKTTTTSYLKNLWNTSFTRNPPFLSPLEEVIPNAMIPIDQIKIWEYWGQRNALNRGTALISLTKGFDYRQFEPLKIAMIQDKNNTEYYCYDGGGRLHILFACGFTEVPCFVVKAKSKEELQRLFLDQKKFVSTINTETKYIQDLALIEHNQSQKPKTWYKDLRTKQKNSYNLAKLLDYCGIVIDAHSVSGAGMIGKGYSTFCNKNTGKKPTYNGSVSDEAPQLADALNIWTSLLNKHFPNDIKYMGSVVLYTGATLWRLSEVEKQTKKTTKLSYVSMKSDLQDSFEDSINDFKRTNPSGNLEEYYKHLLKVDIEGGLTGTSTWGKRDRTMNDTCIVRTYLVNRNTNAVATIYSLNIPTIFP